MVGSEFPTSIHSAHGVIFSRDLTVLLLERGGTSKSRRGQWEGPGGKVDLDGPCPDVSHEAAFIRETREETGLDVICLSFDILRSNRPMKEGTGRFYETHRPAYSSTTTVELGKGHTRYRWEYIIKALDAYPLTKDYREALGYYAERLHIIRGSISNLAIGTIGHAA
jgi:8-oxo-dGTP pyrophosphatase MutT (NUDIX family)